VVSFLAQLVSSCFSDIQAHGAVLSEVLSEVSDGPVLSEVLELRCHVET